MLVIRLLIFVIKSVSKCIFFTIVYWFGIYCAYDCINDDFICFIFHIRFNLSKSY